MRVVYFVHDLNDPAVAKRLSMLRSCGIDAVVAGFWRGSGPPREISGAAVVPLGRTFDSRFVQRAFSVLRHAAAARRLRKSLGAADLYLARNLEMLAVAVSASRSGRERVPIVYEVLDIHRLLLSPSAVGSIMRTIERGLMRHVALLVTSSPAFLREYFEPRQFARRRVPAIVVENKPLRLTPPATARQAREPAPGPPWRIGWFGMLRCRRSLEILSGLAKKRPDLVQIEIAGRPAKAVFGDFEEQVRGAPAVNYRGPYAPEELAALYEDVHFNWAIDYFEEGANSEWLLPNRIYEGGGFDAVPLALRRTETGRWLMSKGLGVLFNDPQTELETFLQNLGAAEYASLKTASRSAPRAAFIADQSDYRRLADALALAAVPRLITDLSERSSQPIS